MAMRSREDIIARCLSNGSISRQNITPTAMRAYVVSPYACYCHFHVDPKEKDATTRFGELLKRWGSELEHRYVDALDPNARKQSFSYDRSGFEAFVDLAIKGEKNIYNPPLFFLPENLAGRPDLLVRDDSAPSDFGDHHYRVIEIKLSSKFEERNKRHYLLQAVLYNLLLGKVQNSLPSSLTMVDRHSQATVVGHAPYGAELAQALQAIEQIQSGRVTPDPVYNTCGEAYWSRHCDACAEAARDVSLIPYLKDARIRDQMVASKVRTIDDLAKLSEQEIGRFKWVGKRAEFFSRQAQCSVSGKELVIQKVSLPQNKECEIYLDLEDTGFIHPTIPHFVFLIGLAVRKAREVQYHQFVIHSEKEVATKTKEFLALLDECGDYQIYHWSKKEPEEFEKIFDASGIAGSSVDKFKAALVDLSKTIEGKVYLPVRKYSVKDVANFFGLPLEASRG